MSEETLENDADFGRLPFDNFSSQTNATFIRFCSGSTSAVQEHWDFNAAGDSQEQWERLVWEWQKLTLLERWVSPSFPSL